MKKKIETQDSFGRDLSHYSVTSSLSLMGFLYMSKGQGKKTSPFQD